MTMEQKNILVKQYIIDVSNKLNAKYNNILPTDKINQAIDMFTNSEKKYEEIIDEIDLLATNIVENYIQRKKVSEEQIANKDRNSRTFEQIKTVQAKVQQLLDSHGLNIFISGGSVPYLLLNQDSNRLHDDIDTVCRLEDMEQLRDIFKQAGLYQEEWDSKNYASDGKDYGFEMKIDGVPFGIYPFSYENGILTQYSYDPYNTQCKIKTLQIEQLSDYVVSYKGADGKVYDTMSLEIIKMTKDTANRKKDIADSLKIIETGMLRPDVMQRIKMFTEIQKVEANKLSGNTIQMTSQLESIMQELVDTSFLSSKQAMQKYSQLPEYQELIKQVNEQREMMVLRINEIRKNNPELSDVDFYKKTMIQFLTPVVQKITNEYKEDLPIEKMNKVAGLLNPDNIVFSLDEGINDIQADSQKGKLIINPEKTLGSTIEEKIVTSIGTSIHETFHLMINMLKSPEQAEQFGERLMYKVATLDGEKEVHFAPGKYGQVLSEGFVEKVSSEFAKKNGFYYTPNPSYIPCVKLCSDFMKQDSSINERFLFTKSGDDIVSKMTPKLKSKFEESERLFVLNNFEVKEIKKDESLKGIKSDSVISSWMEKNDKKVSEKNNDGFQKVFEPQSINQQQEKTTSSQESKLNEQRVDLMIQKQQLEAKKQESIGQSQTQTTDGPKRVLTNNGYISSIISITITILAGILLGLILKG